MSDHSKLYVITGKRLDRLADAVRKIRTGTGIEGRIKEWKKIKQRSVRASHISAFFSIKGFSEKEMKEIEGYVLKLIIPWKLIGLLIFLAFSIFIGIRYYQFSKLPLVYTYDNNIPVYEQPNDSSGRTSSQMDLFGQQFTGESKRPKKSAANMLLLSEQGQFKGVGKNNFISWMLHRQPSGYVKENEAILKNKIVYDQYAKIFLALKGDSNLTKLSTNARKLIFDLLTQDKTLIGSVLADDYPKADSKAGYSRFLLLERLHDNISYLFIRVKTPVGPRNILLQYDLSNKPEINDLQTRGNEKLTAAGLLKAAPFSPGTMPDVHFYDPASKTEFKAIKTPYHDQFE